MTEEKRKVNSAAKKFGQQSRKMSDSLRNPVDFQSSLSKFESLVRKEKEIPSNSKDQMTRSIFGFLFGQNEQKRKQSEHLPYSGAGFQSPI